MGVRAAPIVLSASVACVGVCLAQPAPSLVLQSGDPAPGLTGLSLTNLASVGTSYGGHAVSIATLSGPGVTPTNDSVLLISSGSATRIAAREGIAVPGGSPGSVIRANFTEATADATGRVVFRVSVGPPSATITEPALLRESWPPGGAPITLARVNGPAPTALGLTVSTIPGSWSVSREGDVSSIITLAGTGVTTANDLAVLAHPLAGPAGIILAREAQALPNIGAGATFSGVFASQPMAVPFDAGSYLFRPRTSPSNTTALIVGPAPLDTAPVLARVGDAAPGSPGESFAALAPENSAVSSDGSVAFIATLSSGARALFVQRPGQPLALLLRSGTPAPGLAGFTLTEVGAVNSPPAIIAGAGGHFLISASVQRSSPPFSGFALFAIDATNTVRKVLRSGDSVTGGTVSSITSLERGIDGLGRVAFVASITPAAGSAYRALLAWSPARPNAPAVLLRDSALDNLPRRDGSLAPVTSILLPTSVDHPLPGNQALGDEGTLHVRVQFAGSSAASIYRFSTSPCDSLDFNQDGDFPTPLDLEDFIAANAGSLCPTCTTDLDFNNDGDFPTPLDIEDFIRAAAGAVCL